MLNILFFSKEKYTGKKRNKLFRFSRKERGNNYLSKFIKRKKTWPPIPKKIISFN